MCVCRDCSLPQHVLCEFITLLFHCSGKALFYFAGDQPVGTLFSSQAERSPLGVPAGVVKTNNCLGAMALPEG